MGKIFANRNSHFNFQGKDLSLEKDKKGVMKRPQEQESKSQRILR